MHRSKLDGLKQKGRLDGGLREIDLRLYQAAATAAAFFRFLREPSRPTAPRPVAKSGKVAGRGVAVNTEYSSLDINISECWLSSDNVIQLVTHVPPVSDAQPASIPELKSDPDI